MPYRTYIQMYAHGNEGSLRYLWDRGYVYIAFSCCQYLENHPEKIEELVKERVKYGKHISRCLKECTHLMTWQWLFYEIQIVNTWIHEEFVAEHTEGVIVCGGSSLLGLSSSVSVYDEHLYRSELEPKQAPSPCYVPKHIQHRKKGRR